VHDCGEILPKLHRIYDREAQLASGGGRQEPENNIVKTTITRVIIPNNPFAIDTCENDGTSNNTCAQPKESLKQLEIPINRTDNYANNYENTNHINDKIVKYEMLSNEDKYKLGSNNFELMEYYFDSNGNIIAKIKLRQSN
jgi:hypothetical protein